MKIYCAKHSGFCFGVKRAIKMAMDAVQERKSVYSLGPLIHNQDFVVHLEKKGIETVEDVNDIKRAGSTVIIRSHGIKPSIIEKLKRRGVNIIDATCPKVRRAQRYVEKLVQEGYFVVIIGEKDHPEVKGLLGYAGKNSIIYSDNLVLKHKKIGIVPQTTLDFEHFYNAVRALLPKVIEMKIYNTICDETILRINEALSIAKKVDVMIVIGGKNSANTTRLYQICKSIKPSFHIESIRDIDPEWFKGVKSVGVTAGASTPDEQINKVVNFLKKLKI
jgi:4-hydroxy-3-methylbut-2-enyl diphosphate reductase|uniref:4-hydroxy-3-methylbut-2-enyl diphosphate reductase n=1 Tax=candidate division WOR-3 bacterium TaxID=2052148 RepID=A0A7C4TCA9_UNCW3